MENRCLKCVFAEGCATRDLRFGQGCEWFIEDTSEDKEEKK